MKPKLDAHQAKTCHYIEKPIAVFNAVRDTGAKPVFFTNGPPERCTVSEAHCARVRTDYSIRSQCPHAYATSQLHSAVTEKPATLVLKYFPNLVEHRDIINQAAEGRVSALYFYEASCDHGPFLSQEDHSRLQDYHAFGVDVLLGLQPEPAPHGAIHMRDGKGYFVATERLPDFHKSMLFAFYGSTLALSSSGEQRLGRLLDALVGFWGHNIGIVTGGGSGVMEVANTMARERGILSGANYLDITDQAMTTDVDFCQVFQATCRHSRQKWFEIASFPIFNVGGLGSLEELGITLCNMKLSIMERVPIVLFDTEGERGFWNHMREQIFTMVDHNRAPAWIKDHIVITDDPSVVTDTYRRRLQLFCMANS